MRFAFSRALSPASFRRASDFLLGLLLSAAIASIGPPALASGVGDGPPAVQRQPSAENRQAQEDHQAKQDHEPKPSAAPAAPDNSRAPSTAAGFCQALAAAAASNELPVDFLTRLIWQESRFKPDAISRAGAQGVAQFMPATARSRGLENPFNPLEAIAKSARLLRRLRREFGNLGLAAAAYNAGSGRVRDWLGGRRRLPGETRAYVRLVTGRPVEEWAGDPTSRVETGPVETPSVGGGRCNLPAAASSQPEPDASPPRPKPWGVEVVGGPTPAKALARYRQWHAKYAAIVAGREPQVVIRGIIGRMGAARVRLGEDTRVAAAKLCAALRAAGTYCDVLRN